MVDNSNKNPFWVMVERDMTSFLGDFFADTYEFVRRQFVQLLTTNIQGCLVFGAWNWIIHPEFYSRIGYWQAVGIVFVAKVLLPIHRTDIIPPLTEDELNAIIGETGDEHRSMERTAQSKGVKIKTKSKNIGPLN